MTDMERYCAARECSRTFRSGVLMCAGMGIWPDKVTSKEADIRNFKPCSKIDKCPWPDKTIGALRNGHAF